MEVMSFLTGHPEYLGRWLLQYTHAVQFIEGEGMALLMQSLCGELTQYQ
jgi:hypothetical protein